MNWKVFERKWPSLNRDSDREFSWRDWGKARKLSVRIMDVLAEMRIEDVHNTNLGDYRSVRPSSTTPQIISVVCRPICMYIGSCVLHSSSMLVMYLYMSMVYEMTWLPWPVKSGRSEPLNHSQFCHSALVQDCGRLTKQTFPEILSGYVPKRTVSWQCQLRVYPPLRWNWMALFSTECLCDKHSVHPVVTSLMNCEWQLHV
jgi:hypothetical protein